MRATIINSKKELDKEYKGIYMKRSYNKKDTKIKVNELREEGYIINEILKVMYKRIYFIYYSKSVQLMKEDKRKMVKQLYSSTVDLIPNFSS